MTSMLPILNIALRASRQFNEYVNLSIDRKEHSANDLQEDLKLVRHLEEVFFKTLMDALKKGYPTHYVAEPGEQLTQDKEDAWFFMGFDNEQHLLRKLPDTVYSFVHKKNGKLNIAVIINPFTGAEYVAVKGSGATFNDRRSRVSSTKNLENAYVATDAANRIRATGHATTDLVSDMAEAGIEARVSNCPTLDLALVASGQIDAALLTHVDVSKLDAALLICQEGGALVGDLGTGLMGKQSKSLVAANPKLFKLSLQNFSRYASKLQG